MRSGSRPSPEDKVAVCLVQSVLCYDQLMDQHNDATRRPDVRQEGHKRVDKELTTRNKKRAVIRG